MYYHVLKFEHYHVLNFEHYCKSGNICGTLIFAYFAQIQQARIQKPAKIFAIFCMHILDTYELCIDHNVLMQMGYHTQVCDLLCFCAIPSYIHTFNVSFIE